MDDQTFAQDDGFEPEDAAAPLDDAEDTSPYDDAAPDETDQADEDGSETEPDEDPREALRLEREQRKHLEAEVARRAEEDTRREAERARETRQRADQERVANRQRAAAIYRQEKERLNQQRVADARTAAEANDPALVAQQLAIIRSRDEQAIDQRYESWRQQDEQYERAQIIAERDRSATVEYADYVRNAYGLPAADRERILKYSDGTPVDPNAMSARAAELVTQRKEQAALKRQLKKQNREDGRDELRGRTGAVPGRGRGNPPREFEGTVEELVTYFPMGARRRA
jgi:hypothetical protein